MKYITSFLLAAAFSAVAFAADVAGVADPAPAAKLSIPDLQKQVDQLTTQVAQDKQVISVLIAQRNNLAQQLVTQQLDNQEQTLLQQNQAAQTSAAAKK